MVNRVIQQKVFKMQRMRRAYLKKYSTKNTGPGQKFLGYIDDKGKYVDLSTSARNKAASNFVDKHLASKYRYNPKDPCSIYARKMGIHTDILILARLVQNSTDVGALQGEEKFVYQKMQDDMFVELRLYMGRTECFFVGYKIEKDGRLFFWTSILYGDRNRALLYQRNREITWEVKEEVPPEKADPILAGG